MGDNLWQCRLLIHQDLSNIPLFLRLSSMQSTSELASNQSVASSWLIPLSRTFPTSMDITKQLVNQLITTLPSQSLDGNNYEPQGWRPRGYRNPQHHFQDEQARCLQSKVDMIERGIMPEPPASMTRRRLQNFAVSVQFEEMRRQWGERMREQVNKQRAEQSADICDLDHMTVGLVFPMLQCPLSANCLSSSVPCHVRSRARTDDGILVDQENIMRRIVLEEASMM